MLALAMTFYSAIWRVQLAKQSPKTGLLSQQLKNTKPVGFSLGTRITYHLELSCM